jgi:PAS domain S-box-containing protein
MKTTRFEKQLAQTERTRRLLGWLATFVAPILIVIVGFLVVQQVRAANEPLRAERMSQERRAVVLSVLSAHQDIETGQRGYLLTGRQDFLDPFHAGSATLDAIFPQLRSAYASDAANLERLRRIEAVSAEKRRFSEETVALHRSGRAELARQMIAGGRGKAVMDQLRAEIGALLRGELAHLQVVSRRSEEAAARLRILTFGLLAALLVLLLVSAVAISRMLQQRQRAIVALEDTSRRRAAILNSAMDGILTLNPSGSIETANAAAIRMFGYEEHELLNRDVGMLFADAPPIGRVAEVIREMKLEEGKPGALQEIVGRSRDGRTFPTDVAITFARLTEGPRFVAVVRDITERIRVDRMKAEFVSTVSHELRTPLSSIAGSLGLLAGGAAGELNDRVKRLITIAHTNADRLVRLINDILDVEKLESGKMRFDNLRVELAPAVRQAIDENKGFARSHDVALEFAYTDARAYSWVDPDRLAQVLTNLLSNAIKFSPAGSTVTVLLTPGAESHRITVRDQGPGIPEAFRPHIFGKFAQADSSDTRSKGGTGLGLSIVREIMTRMGGSVSFDSVAEQGTNFHVDLPAFDEQEATLSARDHQLLLCETDDASPLRQALADAGYGVAVASTSAEARALLDSRRFAVVLVDMGLADGSAVEIIRHVPRSLGSAAAGVIAVGEAVDGFVSDPALLVDWLHKPVEIGTIGERIEAAIRSTAGSRPKVLHVDDDPDILKVVAAALSQKAEVTSAASLAEARAAIARQKFDVAVLDLTLRDGRGPELLESLRDENGPIPIVVFSAEDRDADILGQFEAFLTKARTPIPRLVEMIERQANRRTKP